MKVSIHLVWIVLRESFAFIQSVCQKRRPTDTYMEALKLRNVWSGASYAGTIFYLISGPVSKLFFYSRSGKCIYIDSAQILSRQNLSVTPFLVIPDRPFKRRLMFLDFIGFVDWDIFEALKS